MAHQDELTTLVFLSLIALACGPAASLIRRQFMLLREANRHSEALRLLAQKLALAATPPQVWLAVATEIGNALQAECCVVVGDTADTGRCYPADAAARVPAGLLAAHYRNPAELPLAGPDTGSASSYLPPLWRVVSLHEYSGVAASALIRTEHTAAAWSSGPRDLPAAMLQQGADTCRRLQLLRELESARVTAEVEQLRSALLASVSHDLKSPLAAMMGAAESLTVLDKQLCPQDRLELADTILQESRRLDSYIQNLLDMTRLGHGNLQIERDWVEITDVVGAAIGRLKRYFPHARTDYRPAQQPLPLLYINAVLVEQALYNILENACKYAPADGLIRVSVTVNVGAGADTLVLAVEDEGPGIAAADRERVFDMFYRMADGDQGRQSHGMGLAICRGMISAHGGSVRAMAAAGGGSRFEIALPLVPAPPDTTTVEQVCEP